MDIRSRLPIAIAGLSARYGDTPVLDNIDVVFHPGKMVGIIGPSGCGKSTLLKCIVNKPAELGPTFKRTGTMALGDVDIDSISGIELRGATIGMVMQQATAFSGTVFENVASGLRILRPPPAESEIRKRVYECLELTRLRSEVEDDQLASSLSGGQLQRLCIARSLIRNPKVLLLDEPTSALDPINSNEIVKLVENLKTRGIAIVWVSHDINLIAAAADQIIFMDKGRIIERSTDYPNRADMFITPRTDALKRFINHKLPQIDLAKTTGSQSDQPGFVTSAFRKGPTRSSAYLNGWEFFLYRVPTTLAALSLPALFAGVGYTLVSGSWDALHKFGAGFLTTAKWDTNHDEYGGLVPIMGTLLTTGIAYNLAKPAARRIAIYLNEVCDQRLRGAIGTGVDTLAAIPSVIYGLFGATYVAPQMRALIGQMPDSFTDLPIFSGLNIGRSALTAGIIVGFMILPHIAAASRTALAAVPPNVEESARNLGMTAWEITERIKVPYARQALKGANKLGLGRALGETMAVAFVLGSSEPGHLVFSLTAPNTSITEMLANNFQESNGLQLSSLMTLGLVLFGLSAAINSGHHIFKLPVLRELTTYSKKLARPIAETVRGAISDAKAHLTLWPTNTLDNSASSDRKRRRSSVHKTWGARAITTFTLAVPAGILGSLVYNGASGLFSLDTYTLSTPAAASLGEVVRGGLLNSICGSMEITLPALIASFGVGLAAAMHMAEYGRETKLTALNHFIVDNLLSTPSIIFGVFGYNLLVNSSSPVAFGHFSAYAGIAALAALVIPTIVRTAEDALLSVDEDFRRAGASFGAPRGYVQTRILLPIAKKAIVMGVMLSLARISGETAPLLWTALGNLLFNANPAQPTETLQNTIFRFAGSSYDNQVQLAWTAAFLVTAGVVGLNMLGKWYVAPPREKPTARSWPTAARSLTQFMRHPVTATKTLSSSVLSIKARRRAHHDRPG